MKKIEVFYSGWNENWLLGQLAESGHLLIFEFSPEALKQNLELSPLNLKLRPQSYGEFPIWQNRLPGLISDCLPDGWGLLLMDRLFRKNGLSHEAISPLDRLSFIGESGMGALTFHPSVESNSDWKIQMSQIAKSIQLLQNNEASDDLLMLAKLGGSPHGARPKVLVNFDEKTKSFSTSSPDGGEPWIFKFQSVGEHKEVCAIEALYAKLAKNSGIAMKQTKYFDLGQNLSVFGSARFDRLGKTKIPMHTLAGVLHSNFQIPGAVNYTSFLRCTRLMTNSEVEVQKAFRQCVFNVIFNNRDDHAKNFSFVLDKNRLWKLSPAYDLTFNPGPGGEHHMDICGEGKSPGHSDLMKLAKETDVPAKIGTNIIDEVAEAAQKFKLGAADFPIRKSTINSLNSKIQLNLKTLIRNN